MGLGCPSCGSMIAGEHADDCPLLKTYDKPTGFPPRPEKIPDNAIAQSALLIRELHEKNIALMDGGHVFEKDGKNVNKKMRAASLVEIAICDAIIRRSPKMHEDVTARGASLHLQLIEEKQKLTEPEPAPAGVQPDTVNVEDAINEIGTYKH